MAEQAIATGTSVDTRAVASRLAGVLGAAVIVGLTILGLGIIRRGPGAQLHERLVPFPGPHESLARFGRLPHQHQ